MGDFGQPWYVYSDANKQAIMFIVATILLQFHTVFTSASADWVTQWHRTHNNYCPTSSVMLSILLRLIAKIMLMRIKIIKTQEVQ